MGAGGKIAYQSRRIQGAYAPCVIPEAELPHGKALASERR
jgi:hypothetical protein